jgi:metal-responsive CopG/Arc/MetJ family transcriptional regulator
MKSRRGSEKVRRAESMGKARMGAGATRKVVIDFPENLYVQTGNAAEEMSMNRSRFIRSAVENYIQVLQKRKLEIELIEGYTSNSSIDRQVSEDFSFVDAENI